jgi:hypothetical protein
MLTRCVIERLLYRLGCSTYRNQFILKGAMLFRLWTDQVHRPTRDLDLLGKGSHSVERLVEVFKDICRLGVEDDGLTFDPESVRGGRIREGEECEGVRLHCEARLGQPRIDLQIDIGFGDAVTPKPVQVHLRKNKLDLARRGRRVDRGDKRSTSESPVMTTPPSDCSDLARATPAARFLAEHPEARAAPGTHVRPASRRIRETGAGSARHGRQRPVGRGPIPLPSACRSPAG